MKYFTAILLVLLGSIGSTVATPLQSPSERLVERQAVNNVCAQMTECKPHVYLVPCLLRVYSGNQAQLSVSNQRIRVPL